MYLFSCTYYIQFFYNPVKVILDDLPSESVSTLMKNIKKKNTSTYNENGRVGNKYKYRLYSICTFSKKKTITLWSFQNVLVKSYMVQCLRCVIVVLEMPVEYYYCCNNSNNNKKISLLFTIAQKAEMIL